MASEENIKKQVKRALNSAGPKTQKIPISRLETKTFCKERPGLSRSPIIKLKLIYLWQKITENRKVSLYRGYTNY